MRHRRAANSAGEHRARRWPMRAVTVVLYMLTGAAFGAGVAFAISYGEPGMLTLASLVGLVLGIVAVLTEDGTP